MASLALVFVLLIALSLAPAPTAPDAAAPRPDGERVLASSEPVEDDVQPSPPSLEPEKDELSADSLLADEPRGGATAREAFTPERDQALGDVIGLRAEPTLAVDEAGSLGPQPAQAPPQPDPPESDRPQATPGVADVASEPIEARPEADSGFRADEWYEEPERVDLAIEKGCQWLERQQHDEQDFWSLNRVGPGGDESHKGLVAATSLALLALQGAGYDGHGTTREDAAVARGHAALARLHAKAQVELDLRDQAYLPNPAYALVLMCLAVCDLAEMTDEYPARTRRELKELELNASLIQSAQARVEKVLSRQNLAGKKDRGGWGYMPPRDTRSDASLTGWNVRTLATAQRAGLSVPADRLDAARRYLESLWRDAGLIRRYIYLHGDLKKYNDSAHAIRALGSHANAAAGVQLLGGVPQPAGVELLVANEKHAESDVYFAFCGTSLLVRHTAWREWWPRLEQQTLSSQIRRGGLRGAWSSEGDQWMEKEEHGPLCATCFRLMTLEVPRRAERTAKR